MAAKKSEKNMAQKYDELKKKVEANREWIKNHPEQSALIGAGIGALIGFAAGVITMSKKGKCCKNENE